MTKDEALAKEKALQALHDENERLGLYKDAYAEQEPVAWWNDTGTHIDLNVSGRGTPLYTHPVKDLEDININITWNENSMRDFGKDELNFARAILRKAQEK